jgi:hypothetical protein
MTVLWCGRTWCNADEIGAKPAACAIRKGDFRTYSWNNGRQSHQKKTKFYFGGGVTAWVVWTLKRKKSEKSWETTTRLRSKAAQV